MNFGWRMLKKRVRIEVPVFLGMFLVVRMISLFPETWQPKLLLASGVLLFLGMGTVYPVISTYKQLRRDSAPKN